MKMLRPWTIRRMQNGRLFDSNSKPSIYIVCVCTVASQKPQMKHIR